MVVGEVIGYFFRTGEIQPEPRRVLHMEDNICICKAIGSDEDRIGIIEIEVELFAVVGKSPLSDCLQIRGVARDSEHVDHVEAI